MENLLEKCIIIPLKQTLGKSFSDDCQLIHSQFWRNIRCCILRKYCHLWRNAVHIEPIHEHRFPTLCADVFPSDLHADVTFVTVPMETLWDVPEAPCPYNEPCFQSCFDIFSVLIGLLCKLIPDSERVAPVLQKLSARLLWSTVKSWFGNTTSHFLQNITPRANVIRL